MGAPFDCRGEGDMRGYFRQGVTGGGGASQKVIFLAHFQSNNVCLRPGGVVAY